MLLTEAGEAGTRCGPYNVYKIGILVGNNVVRITEFISSSVSINHLEGVYITQTSHVEHLQEQVWLATVKSQFKDELNIFKDPK